MPRQETRRLGRNEARLRTGQHGLRLIKRQADLLELVIALVKAGNHVLAEHGFIIADDPDLDLNSHGLSEGSMADKLQPTCLPQRRPRHPTDFYALVPPDASRHQGIHGAIAFLAFSDIENGWTVSYCYSCGKRAGRDREGGMADDGTVTAGAGLVVLDQHPRRSRPPRRRLRFPPRRRDPRPRRPGCCSRATQARRAGHAARLPLGLAAVRRLVHPALACRPFPPIPGWSACT